MDMQKISNTLESIGMNKNEILIYLDLIKVGSSSAHDISKRTKIHRPNVYDTLDKMIKKGIVTSSIEDNHKVFFPIEPKNLLEYLKQKEFELQEAVPEIEKFRAVAKKDRRIEMAEGIRAFRIIFNDLLEKNKDIFVYGIPKDAVEKVGGFINDFHERRIQKGIIMKHIYNQDAGRRIKYLNEMPCTEARYLPSTYDTTIMTMICGDTVLLTFWEEPIFTIIIENETIAKAYKQYFEIFWEEAKISY